MRRKEQKVGYTSFLRMQAPMAQHLVLLPSAAEIVATVQRLAQELDGDYGQRSPVMVGLLKRLLYFWPTSSATYKCPCGVWYLYNSSVAGDATVSTGHAMVNMELSPEAITHKYVVVVDDIVDTGITTDTAPRYGQRYQHASLLCTLFKDIQIFGRAMRSKDKTKPKDQENQWPKAGGTRTQRNPRALSRISGWTSSRTAERRYSGGLTNDPPRTTRKSPELGPEGSINSPDS